jgi:hypothetical protein
MLNGSLIVRQFSHLKRPREEKLAVLLLTPNQSYRQTQNWGNLRG